MMIVIITREAARDAREEVVNDFVDDLFNSEEIVPEPIIQQERITPRHDEMNVEVPIPMTQEMNVEAPIPMTQEEIVHEPIGQFARGVGIISPLSPDVRGNHLFLGRSMPSERYEFC